MTTAATTQHFWAATWDGIRTAATSLLSFARTYDNRHKQMRQQGELDLPIEHAAVIVIPERVR